jgi:molecular chaperone IbpA
MREARQSKGSSFFYVAPREDLALRTIDFFPFYQSSIGFDRLFNVLDQASRATQDYWPAYDIVKMGDDEFLIALAVPGFAQNEVEITSKPNQLVVTGNKVGDEQVQHLHRGIGARSFTRKFEIADYVKVLDAKLQDGMLMLHLRPELPEATKLRRIEISPPSSGKGSTSHRAGSSCLDGRDP